MIRLYWKNATAEVVGTEHGVTPPEMEAVEEGVSQAHREVTTQWDEGGLGYAALPTHGGYREQVMELAEKHRPGTTDLVVLGIGGSALGNIALHTALNASTYNLQDDRQRGGPRMFVLDNVDPPLVNDMLELLDGRAETTLFNVISKSGETAETASQFLIFRQALRRRLGQDFARRIVATTDPERGALHDIAARDGYDTLPLPRDVGGRFSVLSPVGLFSAAMCGINIDELLAGAAEMARRVRQAGPRENPACLLAAVYYLMMTAKNKPIHVMMPYSNRLYALGDWFRQLWAESLGKALDRDGREVFVGPTPVRALGATDQHSQVQLYREGPNDKLVTFLAVARQPADVAIPDCPGDVPGLAYLRGATLSKLLDAERAATQYALAQANRPSLTIRFDSICPADVGAFIFLYEFVTSLMGELLNVNAYDQPAVQLGKDAAFSLLGRGNYDKLAEEVRAFTKTDEEYLL